MQISHTLLFLGFLAVMNTQAREGAGDGPPVLSLDTVTQAVLDNNPAIKEARAKWQAMQQRVPQAAAWEDLKVSAGSRVARFVSVPRNSFGDQMLSIEQMIPVSGKNKSRARSAAAEALILAEEIRRKQLDVIAQARVAFAKLTNACALLDLNSADEATLQQTVDTTRAKFEAGGGSQADVLTAQNELMKIHEARQDLLQGLAEQETKLCVLMNRDPFKPLGKPAGHAFDSAPVQPERLRALVIRNRPEIRMAEAALVLAKAKVELAHREWIPDPALSLQAQRYNGAVQAASELSVAISFTLPWLNGGKYRAGEKEAENSVEAAQKALDGARIDALGMLRDQLRKIDTAHHHVELYRDSLLPTAKQALESIRASYETNKSGLLDLLTAQRSLREFQSMLQQHASNYQAAVAELEEVAGTSHDSLAPLETPKRKPR